MSTTRVSVVLCAVALVEFVAATLLSSAVLSAMALGVMIYAAACRISEAME